MTHKEPRILKNHKPSHRNQKRQTRLDVRERVVVEPGRVGDLEVKRVGVGQEEGRMSLLLVDGDEDVFVDRRRGEHRGFVLEEDRNSFVFGDCGRFRPEGEC